MSDLPAFPQGLVDDLRALGEVSDFGGHSVEAEAAAVIECAASALREIADGAADPRAIAYVALLAMATN